MTKVTHLSLDEDGGLGRRRIHLREISGDSEIPLETVGQDLRAARLRRGDDLATVSRALKIRKDHLEAVEEDDLESLPGRTYAIGFVRSYATYLGLDTTATVERFKQEISGRHEEHASPAPVMHDDEGRRLPQGWRIVAGIVVVALSYGAWHLFSAGPAPEAVPPAPVVLPPPHVAAAAPKLAPVSPLADNQTATPSPALDDSTNPASPPPATVPPAAPAQSAAAVPAASNGHIYGSQNKGVRVVLRARADTHIEVRGEDGTMYLNRNLKAGDSYNVPNIPGMVMTSTDSGAVELDLDGLAMGRAGMSQQSGDTELDPQSIVDRFNTH
jgi:cytoskeleton protein RodZ